MRSWRWNNRSMRCEVLQACVFGKIFVSWNGLDDNIFIYLENCSKIVSRALPDDLSFLKNTDEFV
jgi:hypothetical protein